MTSTPPDPGSPEDDAASRRRKRARRVLVALILIIFLLLFLRGCNKCSQTAQPSQSSQSSSNSGGTMSKSGKKQADEKQADDDPPENDSQTSGSGSGAGRGGMIDQSEVDKALERLRGIEETMRKTGAGIPVGSAGPSPLAEHLPATLAGHPRVETASSRTIFQGRQGLLGTARATYGDPNAPHITLSLGDSGLAAAGRRIQEFLAGAESVESATEVRRSGRKDGRPYQLTWRENPKKASATILIADRVTAEVIIDGAESIADAEKVLNELPLDRIDSLAASSPRQQGSEAEFGVTDIESVIGGNLLDQSPSNTTDPGAVPEVLIKALPSQLGGLPQVSRRGGSGNPGSAHATPHASSEYAAQDGKLRYRLTLETEPTRLGMLGLPQRTWDRMAALRQPTQQLSVENNRRMMIVQQPARASAEAKILLSPKALLTLSADGFPDSGAAADAALAAIRSLDLDALDAAARSTLANDSPDPSSPSNQNSQ